MAGKSGHVTIRFSYTPAGNRKTQFAALSAALLDSDKFTNVEVTNGAVVNDGDRLLVLGVALPGLKDRLDVEDKDGKLPETVEITADVENFSLPLTVTAASSEWSSTALPLFRQRAEIWISASGRLSKITPMTPMGQLTR